MNEGVFNFSSKPISRGEFIRGAGRSLFALLLTGCASPEGSNSSIDILSQKNVDVVCDAVFAELSLKSILAPTDEQKAKMVEIGGDKPKILENNNKEESIKNKYLEIMKMMQGSGVPFLESISSKLSILSQENDFFVNQFVSFSKHGIALPQLRILASTTPALYSPDRPDSIDGVTRNGFRTRIQTNSDLWETNVSPMGNELEGPHSACELIYALYHEYSHAMIILLLYRQLNLPVTYSDFTTEDHEKYRMFREGVTTSSYVGRQAEKLGYWLLADLVRLAEDYGVESTTWPKMKEVAEAQRKMLDEGWNTKKWDDVLVENQILFKNP